MPLGSTADNLVLFWADEMGRLLVVHDERAAPHGFSVGIACDRAFAGEALGVYPDQGGERAFPLVGPQETRSMLVDAYEWEIETEILRKRVTLEMAKANCFVLGAARISRPRRDSHWKFIFPGKRNWTLSENDDPVPIGYLRELSTITGYPLGVIRQALLTGSLPRRRLRFERYVC